MRKSFLHHICIQTNHYEESLKFYCKMLDMEIIEETPDFHGREYNTWIKNDSLCIELQTLAIPIIRVYAFLSVSLTFV